MREEEFNQLVARTGTAGDEARRVANEVYDHSIEAFMGHSILAVQRYIHKKYGEEIRIDVHYPKKIQHSRLAGRRKSSCVPCFVNRYAKIYIDPTNDDEQKRVCIAHELYHVIHDVAMHKKQAQKMQTFQDNKMSEML